MVVFYLDNVQYFSALFSKLILFINNLIVGLLRRLRQRHRNPGDGHLPHPAVKGCPGRSLQDPRQLAPGECNLLFFFIKKNNFIVHFF